MVKPAHTHPDGDYGYTTPLTTYPSPPPTPSFRNILDSVRHGRLPPRQFDHIVNRSRLNRLNPNCPYVYNCAGLRSLSDSSWEYLDVSPNGTCLAAGSTTISNTNNLTNVESYSIKYNSDLSDLELKSRFDRTQELDRGQRLCIGNNVLGLEMAAIDNSHINPDSKVVDMARASFDTDVTCVLSVLLHSRSARMSTVSIKPMVGFAKSVLETENIIGLPLYTKSWQLKAPGWSGAFDSRNLRVSVGQDRRSVIFDVLTDHQWSFDSHDHTVISQAFSHDGNLLFSGREQDFATMHDLRVNRSPVKTFESADTVQYNCSSFSAGFISHLKSSPNYVITENYAGNLLKWDLRASKPILSYEGHKNQDKRVPVHIDSEEKYVFAVDRWGATRAWTIDDGTLLCEIPSPTTENMHFPRVVYADNWGGVNGNSGLMLAIDGKFFFYDLLHSYLSR
uniref:WD_REPEATS_REGION domain-containing protein n=1 Tax=Panagrellus redivivus TaxID=6233 RepID=A0A7E4W5D4_PANRE